MLTKLEKRPHENTGKTRKMTYAETFYVGDILRLHCKRVGDYAVYDDGWDDEAVLKAAGGTFTKTNISALRQQIVGPLRIVKPRKIDLDTEARLVKLEKIINDLEDWATSRPREPYSRT